MKKLKVMIVDDSDLTLKITRDMLEEADFEVITRAEGMGAITAVLSEKPDCVLMDVSMPASDGPQIVESIKEISNIKIILHSAKEEKELKKLTDECGADGYIKKCDDRSNLIEQIRSTIEKK